MDFAAAHNDYLDPDRHLSTEGPEGFIPCIRITAVQVQLGVWTVRCAEWRFEVETTKPMAAVRALVIEILEHAADEGWIFEDLETTPNPTTITLSFKEGE